MLEFLVIVVGGLVIFDVVYELARLWVRHIEQVRRRRRADQRAARRWRGAT